ncbi:acyltransferase [Paraglaciecola sp.]|uniref:acyltransferase family protein n=1 Tax=Paraglaciecola sp. TaxID=1920173 RepID=UPI0030F429C9
MNKNLQTIQWLRGIAALLVTLVHAANEVNEIFINSPITIPHNFVIGVDLFFIISGFIMVYTTKKYNTGFSSSLLFMRKRIVRVVPIYWFYSLLAIFSVVLLSKYMSNPSVDYFHILRSFFFIPSYYPGTDSIQPILRVGWTLNYEMYFYVLFSLSLMLTSKFRVIVTSSLFIFIFILCQKQDDVFTQFYSNNIIFEFILGMLIAELFLRPKFDVFFVGYRSFIFFITLSITAYLTLVGQSDINDLNYRGFQFGIPAAFLFIAFLSLDSVLSKMSIDKNLIVRIISYLGDSSYTLYLSHLFCIVGMNVIIKKLFSIDVAYAWPYFILVILFTCTFSYLLYFYIEKKVVSSLR